MTAVPHETEPDRVGDQPVATALRALRRLPLHRRTPERIVEVLDGVGLRIRPAAPNPSRAGEGSPRPVVECAACGRAGWLLARGDGVLVEHPPVVCEFPPTSARGGAS